MALKLPLYNCLFPCPVISCYKHTASQRIFSLSNGKYTHIALVLMILKRISRETPQIFNHLKVFLFFISHLQFKESAVY